MPNDLKKTLLITGASGFLGWNLCRAAQGAWRVVGLVNAHPVEIAGVQTHSCDITDRVALSNMFAAAKPSAVIHAAAASQPNWCQKNPEESRRVNVDASIAIAEQCAEWGIPCVFTSSDQVFDGRGSRYAENDSPNPINFYGRQKLEAERGMAAACPSVALCRMPLMFGAPGPVAKSFIQPWISTLESGKKLDLFVDEFRTMVSGQTACSGLLMALDKGVEGVLHLGGRDRVSRYDFGGMLARLIGADVSLIRAAHQADVVMDAPRPADVSLDSSKAYALGYDPKPLAEELRLVVEEMRV